MSIDSLPSDNDSDSPVNPLVDLSSPPTQLENDGIITEDDAIEGLNVEVSDQEQTYSRDIGNELGRGQRRTLKEMTILLTRLYEIPNIDNQTRFKILGYRISILSQFAAKYPHEFALQNARSKLIKSYELVAGRITPHQHPLLTMPVGISPRAWGFIVYILDNPGVERDDLLEQKFCTGARDSFHGTRDIAKRFLVSLGLNIQIGRGSTYTIVPIGTDQPETDRRDRNRNLTDWIANATYPEVVLPSISENELVLLYWVLNSHNRQYGSNDVKRIREIEEAVKKGIKKDRIDFDTDAPRFIERSARTTYANMHRPGVTLPSGNTLGQVKALCRTIMYKLAHDNGDVLSEENRNRYTVLMFANAIEQLHKLGIDL